MTDRHTIESFWTAMGSSRFDDLLPLLAHDFVCDWPHSAERIHGRDSFVQIQRDYPGTGAIEIERLIDDSAGHIATQCRVAWGGDVVFVVSFFTLKAGRITHLEEWWPEPYEPPAGREHLAERVSSRFVTRSA